MGSPLNIFWFRRDLRLNDNAALHQALRDGKPVQPIFIFDKNILDELEDRGDRRVSFIYRSLEKVNKALEPYGTGIDVRYGNPPEIIIEILKEYKVAAVFANHDYDPYAIERDEEVRARLSARGVRFVTCKDQVIFEKNEVVKNDGAPYTVFTPYARKWKELLAQQGIHSFDCPGAFENFHRRDQLPWPSLTDMNFRERREELPALKIDEGLIRDYHLTRDIPGIEGTSRLGVHLRFGTLSVRELVTIAARINHKFLDELIWREFYQAILWHFPQVVHRSFKPAYDKIHWRNNETEFRAWCEGRTGYPLVDAGMRELNTTGYMHNRVRMVAASFLTKHLLVDWRWGEAYFASKLLDYELASNNGGWQWVAGSGCDAAPYFRVFNPVRQAEKFDPGEIYRSRWIPEWHTGDYPAPVVDHTVARERCLKAYSVVVRK